MSVFIGYRHADRPQALQVRKQLRRAGIKTRMEVMDFESLSTLHVTETITDQLRDCTHVILMMSHISARRWWIPFYIGEATSQDRRICVYRVSDDALPEYLQHWPTFSRAQQLDFLIEIYHREKAMDRAAQTAGLPDELRRKLTACDIHTSLRDRIERGF